MIFQSNVWNFISGFDKKGLISEIIFNNPNDIYIEQAGQLTLLDQKFSENELDLFIKEVEQFNNQSLSHESPIIDGSLPDGSRVNILSSEFTQKGPAITVRRYNNKVQLFDKENNYWNLSPKFKDFFKVLVHSRVNILISGGTSSGKTTFLSLLLNEIGPGQRIISIEDTFEIQTESKNILRLISKQGYKNPVLTVQDLVRNSLRMRPDRIIIGEVRGPEANDFIQALNTGHEGSYSTIHSNSALESLNRIENLMLLTYNAEVPIKAVRYQLVKAIDFIVHLKKNKEGERCVHEIIEVTGIEADKILTQDIAKTIDDKLSFTGLVPACMNRLSSFGMVSDFFM